MKKRLMLAVFSLLCVPLFASCATSDSTQSADLSEPSQTPDPVFDLNEYKGLVSECRASINEATLYVCNTGNYELNYWKTAKSFSGNKPDNLVDAAFEWLAENSEETRDTVEADYNSIRQQYKSIILIEIEGKEAEEIDAAFRDMYDAYCSVYNLVVSPSGSLSEFGNNLVDYATAIMDADEGLSLFLDAVEPAE